jgi:hypothetical protein
MTDRSNKKSLNKNEQLDVNQDAILDETESSLPPITEFQYDEDAIDRLLMNSGFDNDDLLEAAETEADLSTFVEDTDSAIELNDFSDFSDFDKLQEISVESTADVAMDKSDDLDATDLIRDELLETPSIINNAEAEQEDDALSDFSDFSDFNESSLIPDDIAPVTDKESTLREDEDLDDFSKQIEQQLAEAEQLSAQANIVPADKDDLYENADDNVQDSASASATEFQDDEDAIDRLLMNSGFDDDDLLEAAETEADLSALDDDTDSAIELNDFSDFSDFDKPQEISVESTADIAMDENDDLDAADLIRNELIETQPLINNAEAEQEDDPLTDVSESSDSNESNLIQDDIVPSSDEESTLGEADDLDDFSKQIEQQLAEAEQVSKGVTSDGLSQSRTEEGDDDFSKLIEAQLTEAEQLSAQTYMAPTDMEQLNENDDDDVLNFASDSTVDDVLNFASDSTDEDVLDFASDSTDDDVLDFASDSTDENVLDFASDSTDEDVLDFASDSTDEDVLAFAPETENIITSTPKTNSASDNMKNEKSSTLEFNQDDTKKQLEKSQLTVKKSKLMAYLALGFGVAAASAAGVLGVMTYNAKTEISKLTAVISSLEATQEQMTKDDPQAEINAIMTSVTQLNQQVYGLISELKVNPQIPTQELDSKVTGIVAKQDMVSKALAMLQNKTGMGEQIVSSGLSGTEQLKAAQEPTSANSHETTPAKIDATHAPIAPAKEESTHDVTPVKLETEHTSVKDVAAPALINEKAKTEIPPAKVDVKPVISPVKTEAKPEAVAAKVDIKPVISPAKIGAKPETAATKVDVKPAIAPTKPETVADKKVVKTEKETVPAKVIAQPESLTAKPAIKAKAEIEKPKKPEVTGIWGVNLAAFKQEWFAKSKAAEFARQGIYADVLPISGNMYRLRVGGFKNKAEANANKARIKKVLNLDSVWVSDN